MPHRYIQKDNGRIYRVEDEGSVDEEIQKLLSLAGAIAIEEKENDWYRVTGAAHRLINRIIEDNDMDKKKKLTAINKIVDEMPGMLKTRIAAVVKALADDAGWDDFDGVEEFAALASINNMMVFRVGEHNGIKYTEKDIEEIAANFKALKDIIRPKLKITHKENQESVAGLASYGDIKSVVVKTIKKIKHLFVSVTSVPSKLAEWINDRRFPERSVEIWRKIRVNGKVYTNVLRNVSMLGHEPPAVPGMTPIRTAGDDFEFETVALSFEGNDEVIEIVTETFEDPEAANMGGGDSQMPEPIDVTEQIAGLKSSVVQLTTDIEAKDTEIAKMKNESDAERLRAEKVSLEEDLVVVREQVSKFEELEKKAKVGEEAIEKLAKKESDDHAALIVNTLELWKKPNEKGLASIFPKDEPVLKALMESFSSEVIKCSLPDGESKDMKEIETSQIDLLTRFVESRKHSSFGEISKDGGDGESANAGGDKIVDEDGRPVDNVEDDARAKKYMADHEGVTYEAAILEVSDA